MRITFRRIPFLSFIPLLILAISAACLKSPSEPAIQEPASITLSSYSIVLTSIGQRVLINATVLDQDSRVIADATIFFRSGNEKIATVGNSGLVTAVSMGSTQITVTSGYATASATVTVMQEAGSITITPPSATLTTVGETVQLTAEVEDAGKTVIPGAVVVWSSSDPQFATVDANGLVTAVSIGTTRITATSAGVSRSSTVYVEIPKPAARIDLNISQATLTSVGQSLKLDALVYDIDGVAIPDAPVAWSSSHPVVAAVDTTGLVSAVANGTTLVTATSGGITTFATIHVVIEGTVPPPPPPVPVTARIEISPPSATLTEMGETLQMVPTVYDTNDEIIVGATVVWSSSDPAVATVDTNGLVTAASNGTTQITATSVGVSTFATINVEIEEPEPPPPPPEPSTDREALIAFYHATDGQEWTNSDNWLTDAPLEEWYGMMTDADGRVTELNLLENNLTGVIPPEIGQLQNLTTLKLLNNNLTGVIPSQFGQLQNLVILDLRHNRFTDSIPPAIGLMNSLQHLRLGDNLLTGEIPFEIYQSNSLLSLTLFDNQLSGEIPSEIEQLANLKDLHLSRNQLTGEIPPEIGQLSNLDYLDLSENQLTGEIPSEIGQLAKLRTLSLKGNQLSGEIPPDFGQLFSLEGLLLHGNRLTGEIPSEIWQLVKLNGLVLAGNRLSGTIPPEIGQLANLKGLNLSDNELTGEIPPQLGKLTVLRYLDLFTNRLSGKIPREIGNLGALERLYLYENQLSGGIPPEIGQATNLGELDLRDNQNLSGPLPIELTALTSLWNLHLEGTRVCVPTDAAFQSWLASIQFTEGIMPCPDEPEPFTDRDALEAFYNATDGPSWTNNTNWLSAAPLNTWVGVETDAAGRVTELNLGSNQLAGVLPDVIDVIGRLERLEVLDLPNNSLSGTIPPELGNLSNLKALNIHGNLASGNIPPELGKLTNLRELHLGHNKLTGSIPAELGQLSRLEYLSLLVNELTGPIPPELGQLSKLEQLWLPHNKLTGGIPVEVGNLADLEILALYDNMLSGEVPRELAKLANLKELHLSENQLSGNIPPELGTLANLKVLALNNNHLTGTLPTELTQLTNLTYLGFRQNGLTGAIPSGLGKLANLQHLILDNNQLEGTLPTELGNLAQLEVIWLAGNRLSGAISPELGKLVSLKILDLARNSDMSGPIPDELTAIPTLEELSLTGTQVCAPSTDLFDAWLEGILRVSVNRCMPCMMVARVEVYPPGSWEFTALGQTRQLSATAYDANDEVIEEVEFIWSSSDTTVATVSENGLVTAVGNGTFTISVKAVCPMMSLVTSQSAIEARGEVLVTVPEPFELDKQFRLPE